MKQRSWLLGCISLLLMGSACAPIAPPSIEIIVTATPAVVQPAPGVVDTAEAEVEAEPAAPTMTFPGAGAELSSQVLELTGTGEPGSVVQILIDGNVAGATEVDSDGNWSLEASFAEPGEHDITVQLLDAAGTVLAETEPIPVSAAFELAPEPSTPVAEDTVAAEVESEPVLPSITFPTADSKLSSRVLEMAGTGEPGSQLQVLVDGEVVGTVTVRSTGRWYLAISLAQSGEQELQLQLLDDAGVVVAETEPINITAEFETSGLTEPETTAPTESEVVPPTFVFPADEADIFFGNLTLLGVGEPNTEVEVLVDGELLDVANVETGGEWTFTFEPSLGVHQLSVQTPGQDVAEDGQVQIRVVRPSDDCDCSSNPGLVRDEVYIVGTCDTLATIGQQLGVELEDLVSANPQVVDPDLIYPGQSISIPQ